MMGQQSVKTWCRAVGLVWVVSGLAPLEMRRTRAVSSLATTARKQPLVVSARGVASMTGRSIMVRASEESSPPSPSETEKASRLPWYFDPGTYGGVIVLTCIGLIAPFALYSALLAAGLDPNKTGVALSGVLVVGSIIVWTLTYVFRVFTKQMTYGQQLKQYEDAVIKKRFEELEDIEVEALMSEIEREEEQFL